MSIGTVLVIAKRPEPGRVKTRLTPPYTPADAAALAAAALADTLDAAAAVPATEHLLVLAGDPAGWLPAGWRHVAQVPGDLSVRLAGAFAAVRAPGPAVLVGMDTPQFTPAHLAAVGTSGHDAWLGPATDGGFWAIGLADAACGAQVLPGVPMSRADTGARQLERLRAAGLTVGLLDQLTDVDDDASAREVAAAAPDGRFAALLRTLAVVG